MRQYETQTDVCLTVVQSANSVMVSFDGSEEQIANEVTACTSYSLMRLIETIQT